MKHLSRSKIEYLHYCWNFYTGCLHWKTGVCPVPHCWARDMEARFRGGFEPYLHSERLLPGFPQKPSRIGVCFTGDLFGDWVNPEFVTLDHDLLVPKRITLRQHIKLIVELQPKHQFLFLTKVPWNYRRWGEFPDNAWLGATAWNTRSALESCLQLGDAECSHRWLSIEPLLASINLPPEHLQVCKIQFVVIGSQSRPTKMPDISWVLEIVKACGKSGIPVWLKNNLRPLFYPPPARWPFAVKNGIVDFISLRQELPGVLLLQVGDEVKL